MAEKRTFLEDISEEERAELHKNPEYMEKVRRLTAEAKERQFLNDPDFLKAFEEDTKIAKERQLKLKEAEQNSKQSKKGT